MLKRNLAVILALTLLALPLAACQTKNKPAESETSQSSRVQTPASPAEPAGSDQAKGSQAKAKPEGSNPQKTSGQADILKTTLIQNKDGYLLLAGDSLYTISCKDLKVFIDGEEAQAGDLKNGMAIDLVGKSDGIMVAESYPGQPFNIDRIEAWTNKEGKSDLVGLYLKVLTDLWQKDPALHSDIKYVSLDLNQAPGLSDGEKEALQYVFQGWLGDQKDLPDDLICLDYSYEDLVKEGFIEKEAKEWKDGVLLSLEAGEAQAGDDLKFSAEMWRSGLGAYCLHDCSVEWGPDGYWTGYQVGSEMVS